MSSKRAIRRRERRKQCQGKARHAIAKFARREARRLQQEKGETVVPYYCRFCGGWHVGHARGSSQFAAGTLDRALATR